MSQALGLYIHLPFCEQLCAYCAFLTFSRQDDKMAKYVDYLIKEINLYKDGHYFVDTIYFGGGTPSYLPEADIGRIMEALDQTFDIAEDAEITIEMNPESVSAEKLQAYQAAGINRYSLGVQSFNDEVLRLMGRLHDSKTVLEKLALMQDHGCDNISIDLMFANPKQDMSVWQEDVAMAVQQDIQHISSYSLMIKENTAYERWLKRGLIEVPDDETDRDMYHYLQDELARHGFDQYEISSFAKPGRQGRHNLKYWTQGDYIGLGMGADSSVQNQRYSKVRTFDDYFEKIDQGQVPILERLTLTPEELEKEYIIVKMRLLEGLKFHEVNQRFGIDFEEKYAEVIKKHLKLGTIEGREGGIAFSRYGLDVGNQFNLDII